MDFLLCVLVSKTNLGPSIWHERIMNFQNMEEIVNIIYNCNYTQQLLFEEEIILFLENSNYIPNPKMSLVNLIQYYYPQNAQKILLRFFDNTFFDDNQNTPKVVKQSIDNEYKHNLRIVNPEMALKLFGKKLFTNNFANPDDVKEFQNNFYNNRDQQDSMLQTLKTFLFHYNNITIPYLNLLFDLFLNDLDIHIINFVNPRQNFFALIRTFQINAEQLVHDITKFIRDFPHPIFAEIFFTVNNDKICWSDSKSITNSCSRCFFPWNKDLFLPQWRCIALCYPSSDQCNKFAIYNEHFCLEHQIQMSNKPMGKNKLKRFYESSSTKDIDPDVYSHAPTQEDKHKRFPNTLRPINPMELIVKRRFLPQQLKKGYYLPIIRYEGIYYSKPENKEAEKKYCGKFFFYEPDSNIYIHLGKSCMFASKIQAYMILNIMNGNISTLESARLKKDDDGIKLLSNFKIGDKYKFPIEKLSFLKYGKYDNVFYEIFHNAFWYHNLIECLDEIDYSEEEQLEFIDKWIQHHFCTIFQRQTDVIKDLDTCIPVFYPTDLSRSQVSGEGVGDFDFLDQIICNFAKNLGYNTIILQHEIGSHDCVTEILHTNNYQDDLYRIEDVKSKQTHHKTKYPKIWFPKQDGIVNEKGKLKFDIHFDTIFTK